MTETYTYTMVGVNIIRLEEEITSTLITPPELVGVLFKGGQIHVIFDGVLSETQETALVAIISAHDHYTVEDHKKEKMAEVRKYSRSIRQSSVATYNGADFAIQDIDLIALMLRGFGSLLNHHNSGAPLDDSFPQNINDHVTDNYGIATFSDYVNLINGIAGQLSYGDSDIMDDIRTGTTHEDITNIEDNR